ncbi:S-adenosyl-methionine cycloartenol-C24-methyltransferase [Aphelenchoides avenae]|nr:S-adenosyl-methionine cycloartenol-C24-methyltransferase [Aphelenchus avenae]
MSKVIDQYFNGNFHFVPPKSPELRLEEALTQLHERIGKCLRLSAGQGCVDIGCGIGGVIKDLSGTGASLTGLTIAPNEVSIGNAEFEELGIYPRCRIMEADCHRIPLEDESQDSAYAVYALKYFVDLAPVLQEAARILRKDGLFVVYDLLKTDRYDASEPEHRETLGQLEYACGMPSLHSRSEMVECAEKAGLKLVESMDLCEETGFPFHFCFTHSRMFMWMVKSPVIGSLIKIAQGLRILPKGFYRFNNIFLSGTVSALVKASDLGILSGSEILVFKKCNTV